ncbi:MAG: hypothetical protein ABL880_05260 [Methylotenera sp.]|jgi:hypothetical protein
MNQKFINNVFINGLLVGSLALSSLQANAEGFHEGLNNNGIAVSSTKFYQLLAKTNMDHLGYNFGAPDEIQTLKDTAGAKVGSVWIYHDAVQKEDGKQDAQFVIINGKLQYATLSDAS